MEKVVNFTISNAVANRGGAMEPETITKNGANSKSQMSRGNHLNIML